jgi:hypothetical protein
MNDTLGVQVSLCPNHDNRCTSMTHLYEPWVSSACVVSLGVEACQMSFSAQILNSSCSPESYGFSLMQQYCCL